MSPDRLFALATFIFLLNGIEAAENQEPYWKLLQETLQELTNKFKKMAEDELEAELAACSSSMTLDDLKARLEEVGYKF